MSNHIYTAGQSLHRDCFCHHVTLAFFPGETSQHFPVTSGVDGKTLAAYRVNRFNGKRLREKQFHLQPDSKVELFASPWPDLFYIVQYSQYHRRFGCSCTQRFCEHVRFMQREARS